MRNTPNLDGAFAELGMNGREYWPTVVYEMAHETVHLLNPTVGFTNWLEEGIAVKFSIHAQDLFKVSMQQPTEGPYWEALNLVRRLGEDPFPIAKRARKIAGALNRVKPDHLKKISPETDPSVIEKLCQTCVPR